MLAVVGVDALADVVEFAQDAVLFAFEQGKRDRVGVVGLQEPFLLVWRRSRLAVSWASSSTSVDMSWSNSWCSIPASASCWAGVIWMRW